MSENALAFRVVTARYVAAVQDSSDADHNPDTVPMQGRVMLRPVYTGTSVVYPGLRLHVTPDPIPAQIRDGDLVVEVTDPNGEGEAPVMLEPLSLLVTEDARASQRWMWRADFESVTAGGAEMRIAPHTFVLPPGDGPLDLSMTINAPSGGKTTIVGPPGPGITSIVATDATITITWDDGRTTTVPVPDAVQGVGVDDVDVTDGALTLTLTDGQRISTPAGTLVTADDLANLPEGLPDGGAAGQVVTRSEDGTTIWQEVPAPDIGLATDIAPGLMPPADRAALAAATPEATPGSMMRRTPSGQSEVSDPTGPTDVANKRYVDTAIDTLAGPDLISTITYPMVVAHRGGAALYPEESAEAMREVGTKGFPLEVDVRILSSGELVCIHDDTVDRTMVGATGAAENLTLTQWKTTSIRPALPGGRSGTPMTFAEFLDEFGGRFLLVPELKPGAPPAVVAQFIAAIKSRSLMRAVIAQSFDYETCKAFADAGIPSMFLFTVAPPVNAGETVEQAAARWVTDGIGWVGPSVAITAANVTAIRGQGIRVVPYTVKSRKAAIGLQSLGVDGHFSDDPQWTSGRVLNDSGAELASGYGWPGFETRWWVTDTDPAPFDAFYASAGVLGTTRKNAGTANHSKRRDVFLRNLGRLDQAPGFEVGFDMIFQPTDATDRSNLGLFLWKNTAAAEDYYVDAAYAGQSGYAVVLRRNGELQVWEYVNGAAAVSLGSNQGAAVAATGRSGAASMQIALTGKTLVASASNGAYLELTTTAALTALQLGLRWSGADGIFSRFQLRRN